MKMSGSFVTDRPSFPHHDEMYRCCCDAVHAKQGTQIISIICTILSAFGIFSTLFGKETLIVTILELIFLCIEIICIVLLFMALYNENKNLLVPFMIWQVISVLICIGLFLACAYAVADPYCAIGRFIEQAVIGNAVELYDKQGVGNVRVQLESSASMHLLVRMAAAFICAIFLTTLLIFCWWLSIVYKCYHYFSDVSRHRELYDRPVFYNDVAYDRLRAAMTQSMTLSHSRPSSVRSDEFSLQQLQHASTNHLQSPIFSGETEGVYLELP